MAILPTVNVQQAVEQLPVLVQQGAAVEIPPRGTLSPAEEIRDVMEISSVLPVRRVDESLGADPEGKEGGNASKKKKLRNAGKSVGGRRVLDVKA